MFDLEGLGTICCELYLDANSSSLYSYIDANANLDPHLLTAGITDLSGTTIAYFKTIISTMQTHYPQSLYRMFLINASFFFEAPWTIMKGFIDKDAAAKIDVIGSDYKEKLESIVPSASLPAFLGGTCRSCASPECIPVLWRDEKARAKAAASGK